MECEYRLQVNRKLVIPNEKSEIAMASSVAGTNAKDTFADLTIKVELFKPKGRNMILAACKKKKLLT